MPKLSQRDEKILPIVVDYATSVINADVQSDDSYSQAKMFFEYYQAYKESGDITHSKRDYMRNYIALYRINKNVKRKQEYEQNKLNEMPNKKRKLLNHYKYELGGWILSTLGNNVDDMAHEYNDLFRMIGCACGLVKLDKNELFTVFVDLRQPQQISFSITHPERIIHSSFNVSISRVADEYFIKDIGMIRYSRHSDKGTHVDLDALLSKKMVDMVMYVLFGCLEKKRMMTYDMFSRSITFSEAIHKDVLSCSNECYILAGKEERNERDSI